MPLDTQLTPPPVDPRYPSRCETPQEIFDAVARHLIAQGRQSSGPDTCQYRGPNGARCAVGIFITDEFFDSEFNERPASDAIVQWALDASGLVALNFKNKRALQSLQGAHDEWEGGIDDLITRLYGVAGDHYLSTAVLDEHTKATA